MLKDAHSTPVAPATGILLAGCVWLGGMALTASPGEAANLGFLEKAPAGQFDETDWKLVRQAVQAALSDTSQEATRSWHNEANEHQGTVRILKSWQDSQGRPCRRFRLDNSAGGYKGSYTNDACQQADGNWVTQDGLRLSWRQRQPFPVDG